MPSSAIWPFVFSWRVPSASLGNTGCSQPGSPPAPPHTPGGFLWFPCQGPVPQGHSSFFGLQGYAKLWTSPHSPWGLAGYTGGVCLLYTSDAADDRYKV